MRSMSFLLLTAALAGCSTAPMQQQRTAKDAAHLDKVLAGKVAQKPVNCLPSYRSGDLIVIDDNTILFKEGRKVYRNDLNGGACNGLGWGNYALVTTQHGQLCRGDIAKVVDLQNGFTVGSCVMGDFVPYS